LPPRAASPPTPIWCSRLRATARPPPRPSGAPSNLYLAAFRFDKPLAEVIVSVLPILGVMLVFVLAITYLPLVVAFPGF
jgi:TRAP-type C4-dicarboxylate transport system permease large subunit